jgi:hypothetical protein
LAKSTNHETSCYAVLFTPLSLYPSSAQISSLALCPQTPSVLNVRDQVSHPYRATGKFVVLSSRVILWLTVSWSVYLGVRHPFRTRDQFFFLSWIILDGFWFNDVGRFLWREVRSALLSWVPFIDSILETPPTWRVMFLYLFPPGTRYCLLSVHFIAWCIYSSYMHNTCIGPRLVQAHYIILVSWRVVQVATQI